MKKEISAGIIIYRKTREGPKFLLLYHGGRYWNFPKGKIERAENSYLAALREIKEEVGFNKNDLKFDPRFKVHDSYVYARNKQKIFKVVIYFLAETKRAQVKISSEHQGFGWFNYRDARQMLMYRNSKENIKRAYDLIRGKSSGSRSAYSKRQGHNI